MTPLTVSRVLNAPLALVWATQTDPVHQAKWLSPGNPDGYKSKMDFRVGGQHFYGMPGPDGSVMYGLQTYRQIEPLKKIVLVQSFADSEGQVAPHPMALNWPREMLSTTEYQDLGDDTARLSVTWLPLDPTPEEATTFDNARAGMTSGWDHMFGQIEAYLATLAG